MSLAFTLVDLLTVLVIVVSTAYAIYRGFISETLLIVAPAAAALVALYFGPFLGVLICGSGHGDESLLGWILVRAGYRGSGRGARPLPQPAEC